jgi:hypothetical protein
MVAGVDILELELRDCEIGKSGIARVGRKAG